MRGHEGQPRTGTLSRCELAAEESEDLQTRERPVEPVVKRSAVGKTDRVQKCILRDSSSPGIRYCRADVPHCSGCVGAPCIQLAFRRAAFTIGKQRWGGEVGTQRCGS